MDLLHQDVTDKILRGFYNVYNELGYGFLEKVYENALMIEMEELGVNAAQQRPIQVRYKGRPVGDYFADLMVEEKVIVELKTAKGLADEHEAQLLNYLRGTRTPVGLLLNFGSKPEFVRKVLNTARR